VESPDVNPEDRQLLETFCTRLKPGARILAAEPHAGWLIERGYSIDVLDPAKDLRFFSVKPENRETFDAVWAGRALGPLKIEEAQRVVAAFFQALKPRVGLLLALHGYPELSFESMIRQNGYQLALTGRREMPESAQATEVAVLALRI
jgi:hypothetical protein